MLRNVNGVKVSVPDQWNGFNVSVPTLGSEAHAIIFICGSQTTLRARVSEHGWVVSNKNLVDYFLQLIRPNCQLC